LDDRVDVAAKNALRVRQRVHDLPETDLADDEQIDIARSPLLPFGNGAEYECRGDAGLYRSEALPKDLARSDGLCDQ